MRSVLAAVDGHPRHVLLFAVTTGLLTGPLSPTAMVAAAAAAAILVAAARVAASASRARLGLPSAASFAGDPRSVSAVLPPPRRCRCSPRPPSWRARGSQTCGSRALEGGPLPHMHGRTIDARAVLLEPVRERAVGPAVVRG